jgi:dihydroxyacetone kinase
VNSGATIVTESIDGLLRTSAGRLSRLDGYPDVKVVLRTDVPRGRVSIISGGGAGHEPAHAGFVGAGLLTAAVSGEIFASPSTEAVLAAIQAISSSAGCLLVVKNYTGDRLNFGLAAERARALGHDVEMVIVADDVALHDIPQPRGIAGTLFVHKIAGAAAESGAPLAEVAALARRVAASIRTIGVSASGVDIPFRAPARAVPNATVEWGLGIHGEPGRESVRLDSVRRLIDRISGELAEALPGSGPVAALINNLGGVSPLEMGIVAGDLLASRLGGRIELVIGPAPLMTSLDMKGFSISVLPLDEEIRAFLTAPSEAGTAWPAARGVDQVSTVALPSGPSAKSFAASANPIMRAVIASACEAVEQARANLDELDAKIGDGDTGSTFATVARRISAELDSLPLAAPADLCARLSQLTSSSMGGSSGALLSVMFAAMSISLAGGSTVGQALADGVAAMERYGGATRGDRTMLDALIPAARVLRDGGSLNEAAAASQTGADSTAELPAARAGRASYVGSEHLVGVTDPGAQAIAVIFRAIGSAVA